ncbi:2-C-methyl-D-erythritol 4-phosphate cytidylyltransferase [Pseudarthrobacter sp. J1738]|uniref:2-C-methyl-D-erythritol 4-phosphate cytidylyltransferase n=1 Tax=unclassified Pseudarthrobacter TaxID=2647000 RepID=UPI003D274ACF
MSKTARPDVAVIVVAAGSGQRLGHGIPKAKVALAGRPILEHALHGILAARIAQHVVVVLPAGDAELRDLCAATVTPATGAELIMVDGGSSRAESVQNALAQLGENTKSVLVHDAARALTPHAVFDRVLAELDAGAQAVIPAIAVVDTIKTVEPTPSGANHEIVTGTLERGSLRSVQTPQGFDLAALRAAHHQALSSGRGPESITDDAMLLESQGVPVHVVHGSDFSLKITTPLDLVTAEGLLQGPLAPRWTEG